MDPRILKGAAMKRIAFLLVAVAALASVVHLSVPTFGQSDKNSAPVYVTKIPPGYRDWRLISVAHEEGNLHSFAAILGNDVAIKAFREGKLPFPGRHNHCRFALRPRPVGGEQQSLWRPQSFVPGPPTNVQFMAKDSKNTRRPAAGVSGTSTRMANRATRL